MSSSPPPRHVARIVDAALGSGIRSCERATGGRMAETYLLGLDGDPARAVCKLGGPSVRTGDVVEPLVLRLVTATTDLPAPAVFASGTLRRERASEAAARPSRSASFLACLSLVAHCSPFASSPFSCCDASPDV